jgi:hypothetical protein
LNTRDFEDKIGLESINGGEQIGVDEASDGLPVYMRGLWFSTERFMTITAFMMPATFTLEVWIRATDGGPVYSFTNFSWKVLPT